jgi:predicted metal-dependent phosphoesterase TrpH
MATKKLTAEQREKRRAADAARYQRDKKKRIAAERKWEREHPEEFKRKRKARAKVNNAVRDGRMSKPAGADFHHTSYSSKKPKGRFMKKGPHRRGGDKK